MTPPWYQKTKCMAWIKMWGVSEEESVSNGSDPRLYLDNRTVVWSHCWEISPQTDSLIGVGQTQAVLIWAMLGGIQECVLLSWTPESPVRIYNWIANLCCHANSNIIMLVMGGVSSPVCLERCLTDRGGEQGGIGPFCVGFWRHIWDMYNDMSWEEEEVSY